MYLIMFSVKLILKLHNHTFFLAGGGELSILKSSESSSLRSFFLGLGFAAAFGAALGLEGFGAGAAFFTGLTILSNSSSSLLSAYLLLGFLAAGAAFAAGFFDFAANSSSESLSLMMSSSSLELA